MPWLSLAHKQSLTHLTHTHLPSCDYSAKCHLPKKEGAKTLRFWLSITRLSLQLAFELRWEYYSLDNEQYYKNAKTYHLSQLRISRKVKIKINLIIHYYMVIFLSRSTGHRGAERVCAPFRLCAALLAHFACMQGRTITLSHPCFGAPALLFVCGSPAWVAPRLACMPFARVPPVLLRPTACTQRERVRRQGGVHKPGGGHGVVW